MEEPEDLPIILMCPVCGSAVDAVASETEFGCGNCGQEWAMAVDVDRMADMSVM